MQRVYVPREFVFQFAHSFGISISLANSEKCRLEMKYCTIHKVRIRVW